MIGAVTYSPLPLFAVTGFIRAAAQGDLLAMALHAALFIFTAWLAWETARTVARGIPR
jgi:hypothetical protein